MSYVNVPFDASRFTGSGGMTFNVAAPPDAPAPLLRYVKRAGDATVWFEVDNATIGGVSDSDLMIGLPVELQPTPAVFNASMSGSCIGQFWFSSDNDASYQQGQVYADVHDGVGVLKLVLNYESTPWPLGEIALMGNITFTIEDE